MSPLEPPTPLVPPDTSNQVTFNPESSTQTQPTPPQPPPKEFTLTTPADTPEVKPTNGTTPTDLMSQLLHSPQDARNAMELEQAKVDSVEPHSHAPDATPDKVTARSVTEQEPPIVKESHAQNVPQERESITRVAAAPILTEYDNNY